MKAQLLLCHKNRKNEAFNNQFGMFVLPLTLDLCYILSLRINFRRPKE